MPEMISPLLLSKMFHEISDGSILHFGNVDLTVTNVHADPEKRSIAKHNCEQVAERFLQKQPEKDQFDHNLPSIRQLCNYCRRFRRGKLSAARPSVNFKNGVY